MRNTLKTAAIVLALTAPASPAEELAPDALVKTISLDMLAAIRQDKDIQVGNPKKIASLVEAKILPTYRDIFAEEVRNHGIDGLIELLSEKNRQNDARPASVNT